MHRVNSLGRALIHSTTIVPLRAPTSVPFVAPRTDPRGSPEAGRLAEIEDELILTARLRHETRWFDWRSLARLADREDRLTAQQVALRRELDQFAATPTRAPPGVSGLYSIRIEAVQMWIGQQITEYPRLRLALNTYALPTDLRAALDEWRFSDRDALPYYKKPARPRYQRGKNCLTSHREMFDALEAEIHSNAAHPGE